MTFRMYVRSVWNIILAIMKYYSVSWFSMQQIVCTSYKESYVHYIGKNIGSPPSNKRFDYFSNFQVIGVRWWAGSRSAFKVTPEVFSWDLDLSYSRPVKFFHTDWIIISLWSLSYTQRHCHVRIEKGLVQTVAIKLDAHNWFMKHTCYSHQLTFL